MLKISKTRNAIWQSSQSSSCGHVVVCSRREALVESGPFLLAARTCMLHVLCMLHGSLSKPVRGGYLESLDLLYRSCNRFHPCAVFALLLRFNIPKTLPWLFCASLSGAKRDSGRRRPALIDSRTLHMLAIITSDPAIPVMAEKHGLCKQDIPFHSDVLDSFATSPCDFFLYLGSS